MVQAPTRGADAPPGFYMLFVLNDAGVPSVAQDGADSASPPTRTRGDADARRPRQPDRTVSAVGQPAARPRATRTATSWATAPPACRRAWRSIRSTGVISGTPTTRRQLQRRRGRQRRRERRQRQLRLDDHQSGAAGARRRCRCPRRPRSTAPRSRPAPAASNPRYRWNFDDGSAETAWSIAAHDHPYATRARRLLRHADRDRRPRRRANAARFAAARATCRHRGGRSRRRATCGREPGGGHPRLWVVNQDNDSVERLRHRHPRALAEIPVGAAPRTIARRTERPALGGQQAGARRSASSIRHAGRQRARSRCRAGRSPSAWSFAPDGRVAYVSLEATGTAAASSTRPRVHVVGDARVGARRASRLDRRRRDARPRVALRHAAAAGREHG